VQPSIIFLCVERDHSLLFDAIVKRESGKKKLAHFRDFLLEEGKGKRDTRADVIEICIHLR